VTRARTRLVRTRLVRTRLAVALVAFLLVLQVPAPAYAASHDRIEGSGSSWSANALNQWIAAVEPQGLQVVFTSTGSAQGRKDFALRTVDYAVTDIPYLNRADSHTGEVDNSGGRPYAYLPIVAGGTSFPYQVRVAGQLVRNIRLSGRTLARIFTGQITNWNDSAITSDNNGRQLPSLKITPVLHAEGSGSTAQFTAYLAKTFPDLWGPYNNGSNDPTEYYPTRNGMVAQNGSDGVMNYLMSSAANGAIGYDEYSYPLNADADGRSGYPVAKIENAAHYFTLPDQYNVAKSLTQAIIDNDPNSPTYLIQKLDNVYKYDDKRTYPLSSYSYMLLPVGNDSTESRLRGATAKRQTLVDFLYYAICAGQRGIGPTGYSPLPINLVNAGFDQIQKLKTADPKVDITRRDVSTCNNPTFIAGHPERNYLAEIAPFPPECDKRGQGPCTGSGGSNGGGGGNGGGGAAGGGGSGPQVDPDTGQVIPGTDSSAGAGGGGSDLGGSASDLAAARSSGMTSVLAPLAVIELLALLVVPVLLNQRHRRRRDEP
jgi:ABC-type phosphate transport system substrate-binding protein